MKIVRFKSGITVVFGHAATGFPEEIPLFYFYIYRRQPHDLKLAVMIDFKKEADHLN